MHPFILTKKDWPLLRWAVASVFKTVIAPRKEEVGTRFFP